MQPKCIITENMELMNKQSLISILLTVLMSMTGAKAYADFDHDIEVPNSDGVTIYYSWINNKTELSVSGYIGYGNNYPKYKGDIVIPESVEYEGNTYSVTSISSHTFEGCSEVTSITIPSSIKSIGSYAFSFCSSLTSITIPNAVTTIYKNTFEYCSSLISIYIHSGITSIATGAFMGCSSLQTINVDKDNENYDSRDNCNAIIATNSGELIAGCMNTIIPQDLKSIADYAFYGCTGLTSVSIGNDKVPTVPDPVPLPPGSSSGYNTNGTSIGNYAFFGCSNLASVTIRNSVTKVGHYAFDGCKIETMSVPETIERTGSCAFGRSVKNLYMPSLNWLLRMNFSTEFDQKNDPPYQRYPLLTGVNHLFVDGKEIVDLEVGYEYSGSCVFYGFKGLRTLKIKGNKVGSWAYCSNLESVEISEGVTSIPENAFEGCSKLMSIKIPSTVTSVGKDAFYKTGIYNSQADGVYYVDNWACGYKGNADENTVANIKDGVIGISNIPAVGYLNIPASVKYSSSVPMKNVKTLIIDSQSCLESLSLTSYPKADKLETLILGNAISTIPKEKFKNLSNLKTVLFGYGLREIKSGAFIGCEGLEKIRIPNGVTTIESNAFRGCKGLTTLTIPGSVTSIGDYAFGNCLSLVSVNSFINVPKVISENVFGCSESGYDAKTIYYISTLYVPRGRTTIYSNVSSWKFFSDIQEKDIAYELTYVLDNEIYKSMEIQEGITVTPETDPVKDGYVFGGWKTVPETMPASDVIVYGQFWPYKQVEIADIVNCVFGWSGATYREDLDTNHDGKINVEDIVTAIKQRK